MINSPLKIGITGGIGAGKSLVCEVFSILNIPVYHADEEAKTLLATNPGVVGAIKEQFGERAYLPDGSPDRRYLAENVFSDERKLKIINGIVHPAVAIDFEAWCARHLSFPYIVKEAALLVEAGSYKELDRLITVTAPEETRIMRVLSRDPHRNLEQVRQIIAKQLSEENKVSVSDYVIVNDNHTLLIPQVIRTHQSLINSKHTG